MSEQVHNADVLIIGAGLSGLMAARALQERGISSTVLDKGSSVGGRMATRRIGPGLADHGAQFFTVRDNSFRQIVDRWLDERLVFEWSQGFSDGSLLPPGSLPPTGDGHPRYAAHGGMNALTKHLAAELSSIIMTHVKVMTATADASGWILQDEDGNLYTGQALIMTPPVPQSLDMLDAGATDLAEHDRETLQRVEYAPCLTGLFWVEGRVTLPYPGAVQRRDNPISWIADNQAKGISPDATLITVQANETYSAQMWSAPDERILNALRTDLQIFMPDDAQIRDAQIKRWRYSQVTRTHPDRCLVADLRVPLIFAGDAFGGPRVEGAILSGIAAGQTLAEQLQR
jgi:hypothetical protein